MNTNNERRSHLETPSDLGIGWNLNECSEPPRVIRVTPGEMLAVLCIGALFFFAAVGFMTVVGGTERKDNRPPTISRLGYDVRQILQEQNQ